MYQMQKELKLVYHINDKESLKFFFLNNEIKTLHLPLIYFSKTA